MRYRWRGVLSSRAWQNGKGSQCCSSAPAHLLGWVLLTCGTLSNTPSSVVTVDRTDRGVCTARHRRVIRRVRLLAIRRTHRTTPPHISRSSAMNVYCPDALPCLRPPRVSPLVAKCCSQAQIQIRLSTHPSCNYYSPSERLALRVLIRPCQAVQWRRELQVLSLLPSQAQILGT